MTREIAIQKVIDELMINNVCLIFNPHIFGAYMEQLHAVGFDEGIEDRHHKTFISRAKEVEQYSLDGVFKRSYKSCVFAYRATGIHHQNITNVCKGIKHSAGGYIWKYKT